MASPNEEGNARESTEWFAPAKVFYHSDGAEQLQPFTDRISARIVDALAKRKARVRFINEEKVPAWVDLKKMKLIVTHTAKEYDVVVEMPIKSAVKSVEDAFGRTQLFSALLEDLCTEDFFKSIIVERASPLKIASVNLNHHAQKGGKLYDRFFRALEEEANKTPTLIGEIIDFMSKHRICHKKWCIEYAFHGTPPANLSGICENGMDPNLRRYAGDYFGPSAQISLPYCEKGGPVTGMRRLVVFMLFLSPRFFFLRYPEQIVMTQVDHELPIATVDIMNC